MKRVKLTIAYDGTNYCGWQVQPNGISIQATVQQAIEKLLSSSIMLTGASRTDSGVHALGQVAVFDTDSNIPADRMAYGINNHLPKDIIIQGSNEVRHDFHPRYHARNKTYEYKIWNRPFDNPLNQKQHYFLPKKLDVLAMQEASKYIIGEYDFKSFAAINMSKPLQSTTRTIYEMTVTEQEGLITLSICGNGFLYNMVRIIAGTLIDVGYHRIKPEEMTAIIAGRDRTLASATAPAKGLLLKEIIYEDKV